jgi:hypothetical protein
MPNERRAIALGGLKPEPTPEAKAKPNTYPLYGAGASKAIKPSGHPLVSQSWKQDRWTGNGVSVSFMPEHRVKSSLGYVWVGDKREAIATEGMTALWIYNEAANLLTRCAPPPAGTPILFQYEYDPANMLSSMSGGYSTGPAPDESAVSSPPSDWYWDQVSAVTWSHDDVSAAVSEIVSGPMMFSVGNDHDDDPDGGL